ncbi:hypothetical protein [Aeromonas veronii]|uniref:hypothetical protein n=1 Tax=Aeromonas veronii TaxID=654 RepID=UPI00191D7EBA|nr:hypothetical protein [Aeromonas veronii]MBL0504379.1 hypothetical protein [Aeromonas veronii]
MIDLGGRAAITDVGTMVFLPSTQPKLTLGDQEYLRSGVIAPSATYPDFPFVDGRVDVAYDTSALPGAVTANGSFAQSPSGDIAILNKLHGNQVLLIKKGVVTKHATPQNLNMACIVFLGGEWFLSGAAKIFRTADFLSFTDVTPTSNPPTTYHALTKIAGKLLLLNDATKAAFLTTSDRGTTWSVSKSIDGSFNHPSVVYSDDDIIIACIAENYPGSPDSGNVISTRDGVAWQSSTFGIGQHVKGAKVAGWYMTFDRLTGNIKRSRDMKNWIIDSSLVGQYNGEISTYTFIQLPDAALLLSTSSGVGFITSDGEIFNRTVAKPSEINMGSFKDKYQYSYATLNGKSLLVLSDGAASSVATEDSAFVGAQQYTPNLYLRVK